MSYKPTHANGTFTKFGAPEIEKLYNDRYRIVVRCNVKGVDSKWHYSNVNNFWKDFGSLYDSPLQVDGADVGWEPATGETYPNMRLVGVAQNYPRTPNDGAPVLEFTYETLTGSYVQDADDKVDHELNGLRRVTRTVIATEDASYAKVVGTATIAHTGRGYSSETLTLASEEEVPKRQNEGGFTRIQETWVASGTLSETTDKVGSQQSKVIETIGADPATPSDYSLASKQESNFEGLQTNRFTFLKDNVVLSESEDKVGSQEAIVKEVFNGTPDTPSGYSIASKQESDVDGIPTKRFTFLKDNVELSRSEDKIGSQLAITTQVFNPTVDPTEANYSLAREEVSDVGGIPTKRFTFLKDDVKLSTSEDEVGSQNAITEQWFNPGASRDTKAGYSLARKEESDVDGIPTERYTFLKPSILSLRQELSGGSKQVSVQAFGLDEAAVILALSEVTDDHVLLSQSESDYAGIKTTTFEFRLDESFTEDYELNGLQRISLVELSVSDFTAQTIGSVSASAPTTGLYLGTQKIDNGGAIKIRESVWLEPGELSRDVRSVGRGVEQTTHQFLITEGSTTGDVISRDIDDFEGLKRITVSVIAKPDGTTLTESDGSEKLNYSYQSLVPFTFPGVVDLQNEQGHIFPAVRSPVQANVKADIYTFYQESNEIVSGDFTKALDSQTSLGLWNPSEWCQKISTISAFGKEPAYFNAQGLRGCRTRESFKLSGSLYASLSNNLKYESLGQVVQINSLELEETTEISNGKSVFKQVLRYTNDLTRRLDINVGGVGVNVIQTRPQKSTGVFTVELKWNGSQWVLSGTNKITDTQPSHSGVGDSVYVYSQASGSYLDVYTNATQTTTTTFFTSTNGANSPEDADWPSGVTTEALANEEEYSGISVDALTLDGVSVDGLASFIEGREVPVFGQGNIRISGGPPNPLGKVYTLDVELEKVFTKLDGTDVYRKTIVIANCTPA